MYLSSIQTCKDRIINAFSGEPMFVFISQAIFISDWKIRWKALLSQGQTELSLWTFTKNVKSSLNSLLWSDLFWQIMAYMHTHTCTCKHKYTYIIQSKLPFKLPRMDCTFPHFLRNWKSQSDSALVAIALYQVSFHVTKPHRKSRVFWYL